MTVKRFLAVATSLVLLSACVADGTTVATSDNRTSMATKGASGGLGAFLAGKRLAPDTSPIPPMRWDHRPEAEEWTEETITAISTKDPLLAQTVPADVQQWCPGYAKAGLEDRRAFWAGMFSALAKHESTWNPRASGGGGRWIGLTQISPATARHYGCDARSAEALKDGEANLRCAVEIAAVQVARDKMVAGAGNRGMGRDWAPFRSAAKREDMRQWISQQPYCEADQPKRGRASVVMSTKDNR